MWTLTRGEIPEGLQVLHKCDTRCCINPDHLFLGTNKDNVDDKVRKGRHPRGQAAGGKMTEDDVRAIRAMKAAGAMPKAISETLGVTRKCVEGVIYGWRWNHVV